MVSVVISWHLPAVSGMPRWITSNGRLTEYSALYPPAFGDTIAFAYAITNKYQYKVEAQDDYILGVAKLEIERFIDDLLMRMPTTEKVLEEAEATRWSNSM